MNFPALDLGVLVLLFPLWPVVAIGSAIIFYVRHRNRVEPERRVPVIVYVLAVIVCGGGAGLLGVGFGIKWACSLPEPGNLCGLAGFLVVGPIAGTLAIVLVGLAISLIRPAESYQPVMERPPVLTRHRMRLAYAIAVTTDVLQVLLLLGSPRVAFASYRVLDVLALILTWRVIGFHPLLLPTFALEFLPFTHVLPTWTAGVALVVALRKRQQIARPQPPAQGPVIDV